MSNRDKTHDTDISTMVHHVLLNCEIYPMRLVSLFALRYIKKNKFSTKKKIDLPEIEIPGELISSSYKTTKRGIIRSNKTIFKNAMSIDIASNTKFVNLRISPMTIQGFGSKSNEMLNEALEYTFQHIKYIQYILDKMKVDPDITNKTIEWIKEKTKGPEFMVIKNSDIIVNSANIQYYQNKDNLSCAPSGLLSYISNINEKYNSRKKIGRMLDYVLIQSIERSLETNLTLISKYNSNTTLCSILNVLFKTKTQILSKLRSTVLILTNNIEDMIYYTINESTNNCSINPTVEPTIEKCSNYINTVSYIITTYQITLHTDNDVKTTILYYIFNSKLYTIKDILIIKYFSDLLKMINEFHNKPIYKEVELTNKLIYPNLDSDNENIDHVIVDYLLRLINDYKHHDIYSMQLDWIKTVDRVFTGDLSIKKIKFISSNFNYNLGYKLVLRNLIQEFDKLDGFNASRDQQTQKYVTVQIPYKITPELSEYIQKDEKSKKLYHSFLIYSKGSVTQSGPLYEMNIQAYHMFIDAFESLIYKIVKRDKNTLPIQFNSPVQYALIE